MINEISQLVGNEHLFNMVRCSKENNPLIIEKEKSDVVSNNTVTEFDTRLTNNTVRRCFLTQKMHNLMVIDI